MLIKRHAPTINTFVVFKQGKNKKNEWVNSLSVVTLFLQYIVKIIIPVFPFKAVVKLFQDTQEMELFAREISPRFLWKNSELFVKTERNGKFPDRRSYIQNLSSLTCAQKHKCKSLEITKNRTLW